MINRLSISMEAYRESALGFEDPTQAARLLRVLQTDDDEKGSTSRLAFCFLLAFRSAVNMGTLCHYLTSQGFTPEELLEILEKATVDTGEK